MPTRVTGGTLQVWKEQRPGASTVAAVFNLGSGTSDITVDLGSLGLSGVASAP
jgi:hypothetical protein